MILIILLVIHAAFSQASLADDLEVHSYELSYKIDMENDFEFFGNVSIIFRSKKNLNSFFIHSNGLDIADISLTVDEGMPCPFTNISKGDLIIVNTKISLKPTYTIHAKLQFHGTIGEQLEGMYRSSYPTSNSIKWLVSTHFEPIFARKAFPCFDQPLIRAIFKLDFTVKDQFDVIFNTPLENSVELGNGWKMLTFKPTPAMPTYTLAWAIHDNSYISTTKDSIATNVSYSVYSPATYSNLTNYAMLSLEKLIPAYDEYTSIPYSSKMSKIDLLAIPELYFGAMENWGIITFRENLLFYDQNNSNSKDMQDIFTVIAHELAHQWFGNLVTLQWWSYTWLNEGFAQYLEYTISNKINPEWELENQFVVEELQKALELDNEGSHPMTNVNLTTDAAVTGMFDFVSYKKGSSILRMLSYITNQENFRTGLNIYLQNVIKLGGVSTPDYLWSALSLITPPARLPLGVTLAELMKSWTETHSYPIVHVQRQGNTLKLHQTIFEWNMKMVGHWWIPIFYTTDKNPTSYNITWLHPQSELSIEIDPDTKWYFINLNQIGYFRVNYDEKNWIAFANVLIKNPATFNTISKSQIINDAISLMRAGHLKSSIAFQVLEFLNLETEYLPWKAALDSFQIITQDFKFSPNLKDWKAYVSAKLDKVLNKVMIDGSSGHLKNLQKLTLLEYACNYEHPYCLQAINETSTDREFKDALDCSVMKNASQQYFNSVLNTYLESNQSIQRWKLLKSLTCTNNGTLQRILLDLTYTQYIKKQDAANLVIKRISSSPLGAKITMQFLDEKYGQLHNRLGGDLLWRRSLLEIIEKVAENTETEKEIVQIGNFLKKRLYSDSEISKFISKHKTNLRRRKSVEYETCKSIKCSTAVTGGTTVALPLLSLLICTVLVLVLL